MSMSWMFKGHVCEQCGYEIVVTQGSLADYRYYCSNLECSNHKDENVEDLDDMADCGFAIDTGEI